MSFTTVCDKNLETMVRNEFEAEYLQGTLDLILEMIEGLVTVYDDDREPYVPSYHNYNELLNILRYRHPEEYWNMIERARERDLHNLRKKPEEDPEDE